MSSRVRTVIVDDEPLARRFLRSVLETIEGIEVVGEASNGAAAIDRVRDLRPDLLLLDIQMPGKNGFDVLRAITGPDRPLVVFVTAHDEHAVRAFDVQAVDYVLKPLSERRVQTAVQRAVSRLHERTSGDAERRMIELLDLLQPATMRRLSLRTSDGVRFIDTDSIDWIGAERDFVRVHVGRESLATRSTMAEIESRLPRNMFLRVHRGVIVNLRRVSAIEPWFKGDYVIKLYDGTKLRSGRTYRSAVQALVR